MKGAAVLALEGRGDALLAFEDASQAGPALALTLLAEAAADGLHHLVGDHGDEQVAVGAPLGLVEDGAQAEFRLERSEHGLHIGQGGIGPPQRLLVLVLDIGAQAVDAGMGDHGAGERAALPGDGVRLLAAVVGDDVDVVVGRGAAALLPDPADALPDMVEPLAGARPRQAVVELLQLALEARGEAVCDALFLLRPRLGVAVEPRLSAFGVDHLVDMDRLARPGLDGQRQLGIEAAGAFPADRQIAVAVPAQPGDVGLGGDPRIHHHQRVRRRAQGPEHRRQGPALVDRAREHLGAAHEARAVEHQPQGQERAIRALLLGMAARGLGLGRRRALEEGVGQVVERHRGAQPEQGVCSG